jgi:hypothetical protein
MKPSTWKRCNNFPLDFGNDMAELNPDKTYTVRYCGGFRSMIYFLILVENDVVDVDGGFALSNRDVKLPLCLFDQVR